MDCNSRFLSSSNFNLHETRPRKDELIDLLNNSEDLCERLENIKLISNLIPNYTVDQIDNDILQHIMPRMIQMIKEVIDKNTELANNNDINAIKQNLQIILTLLKISEQILQQILEESQIEYRHVYGLPTNLIQILSQSFEHCKSSENLYKANFKEIDEILELFRLSQDLHTKLLNLCAILQFDYVRDTEDLKNVLVDLCKLGEILSGLNMKSSIDNWKSFILITQKHSSVLVIDPNLSVPISFLRKEIENSYDKIGTDGNDLKTINQHCKMIEFFNKIALKLYEIYWDNVSNFSDDIIEFSILIYSFSSDYFKFYENSNEISDSMERMFECHENFLKKLIQQTDFCRNLHKSIAIKQDSIEFVFVSRNFGILKFLNKLLNLLPEINDHQIFPIITIINQIFNSTKVLYREFYFDSDIFQGLIVNITVSVVIFPQYYKEIEEILLRHLLQHRIWPALLSLEIWVNLLRNSPSTCRATIETLLEKIIDFDNGNLPQLVFLNMFLQRIFDNIPNNDKNILLSKYSNNLKIWKWFNINNIPLSQRFHIETLFNDLYEKITAIDNNSWNINDGLIIAEIFEILANIDCGRYQLNNTKLLVIIERLWSFNLNIEQINQFTEFFLVKLCKITKTVIYQISDDVLLLVLNQMKLLSKFPIFKLIICDYLQLLNNLHFDNNQNRIALIKIIYQIFVQLSNEKNPVISVNLLEIYQKFSENTNYNDLCKKITENCETQQLFEQRNNKICLKFHENVSTAQYEHKCNEFYENKQNEIQSPLNKKIKIDDYDVIINELKSNVKQLENYRKANELTNKQIYQIRGVLNRLEGLM